MDPLLEKIIIALSTGAVTGIISFIATWAVVKEKVKNLEGRMAKSEEATGSHAVAIAKQDTEMETVHRQLDEFNKMKIESNFAEVKAELRHIHESLRELVENTRRRQRTKS